jgi:Ca-activated chloride channel family protein
MTFLSRELLWLLLAVPALIAAYVLLLRRKKQVLRYTSLGLVREAVDRTHSFRRHLPPLLFLLSSIALMLAVARPAGVVTILSPQRTILLAMDVSLSMSATDVLPSRLAAAQTAAKAFIRAQPSDVRVGIIAFAGTAALVQVPTANRASLYEAIDGLRLEYHTAIGTAIIASLVTIFPDSGLDSNFDIFGLGGAPQPLRPVSLDSSRQVRKPDPVPAGSYSSAAVVLLTDGSRTMGIDPLAAARMAADRGVRIFTVGFGSAAASRVEVDGWSMDVGFDEGSLKEIADITRGEYFRADSAQALNRIYGTLAGKLVVERKETEMTALFTAAAAVLSLLAAALSVLWFPRAA